MLYTEELVTLPSIVKQLPSSLPTPCSCPGQAGLAAAADQDQEEGRGEGGGVASASPAGGRADGGLGSLRMALRQGLWEPGVGGG